MSIIMKKKIVRMPTIFRREEKRFVMKRRTPETKSLEKLSLIVLGAQAPLLALPTCVPLITSRRGRLRSQDSANS
jgi:hypothetical protein